MITQLITLRYKKYCNKKNITIKVMNLVDILCDNNGNMIETRLIDYIVSIMIKLTNDKVDFNVSSMEEFLENITYLDIHVLKEYIYEKFGRNEYNLSKENPRIIIKLDYSHLYNKIFDLYLRQDPLAYKRTEFIKSIESITANINANVETIKDKEYKNNLIRFIDPNIFWLRELTTYL